MPGGALKAAREAAKAKSSEGGFRGAPVVSMDGDAHPHRDADADSRDGFLKGPDHRRCLPVPGTLTPVPTLGPPSPLLDSHTAESSLGMADVVLLPQSICVTLDLPGVSDGGIDIEATERQVTVSFIGPEGRPCRREIALPVPGDSDSLRVTFRNGVLDIVIARRLSPSVRGRQGEGHV